MVDDQIGDELDRAAQGPHVFPGSQPGIDLSVIDRVKSGVGAVDGSEEGQQVRSAEDSGERPLEQATSTRRNRPREAVDVGNELNLVFHGRRDQVLGECPTRIGSPIARRKVGAASRWPPRDEPDAST